MNLEAPTSSKSWALVFVALAAAAVAPLFYASRGNDGAAAFDSPASSGADISQSQRDALADGEITETELEAAFERAAACLVAHGIEPIRLGDPLLEGEYQFAWKSGPVDSPQAHLDASYCKRAELESSLTTYQRALFEGPVDTRERHEATRACLARHGVGVRANLSEPEVRASMKDDATRSVLVACVNNPSSK